MNYLLPLTLSLPLGLLIRRSNTAFSYVLVLVVLLAYLRSGLERELHIPSAFLAILQDIGLIGLVAARWKDTQASTLARTLTLSILAIMTVSTFVRVEAPLYELPSILRASAVPFLALLPLDTRHLSVTLRTVVIGGVISSLFALRQSTFGFTASEIQDLRTAEATYIVQSSYRLLGASGTGQEFSMLIALSVVCAVWLAKTQIAKRSLLISATIAFLAVSEFLALQRLAVVATCASLIALRLRSRQGRNGLLRPGTLLILPLAASLLLLSSGGRIKDAVERAASIASFREDSSFLVRITELWPKAWTIIERSPFIGWGSGSSGVTSLRNPSYFENGFVITDNLYLAFTIQFGFPALGLLFTLGAQLLGRSHDPQYSFRMSLLVLLVVAGLVGTILGLYSFMGMFCLVLGAARNTYGYDVATSSHIGGQSLTAPGR